MSDAQTREIDRLLERTQEDTFWVPDDVSVVDRPEVLYLTCPRDVPGLNGVLRVRATAERVAALVAEVTAAHAGRRSRWALSPNNRSPALEAALADAGYAPTKRHYGYALSTDAPPPARQRPGVEARPVETMEGLLDAVTVGQRAFGYGPHSTEAERRIWLEECTRPGARVHRVVAYDAATGEPLSSGGITAFRALGFGFLWAGGTVPEGRGRGAYGAVLAGRIAWARSQGLRWVGLYARVGTSAPIVDALGFARCGEMTFWQKEA